MSLNLVGGNAANAVPITPYTPPVSASPAPVRKQEDDGTEELDQLLGQLSQVLSDSVKKGDTRAADAILKYLAGDGAVATDALPPALVDLLDTVVGTAEQAGKADEFKALLGEYVALQWAISELDAMIAEGQAAAASGGAKSDEYYEKLAAAKAFLKQLEAAIVGRLDTQSWYTNWRELYQTDFAAQTPAADSAALRSQIEGADAVSTVAILLKAAPRPDLSQVEPAQVA